jgi:hypothetical protein
LPPLFLAILVLMAATYLALAELAKSYFFRHEASAAAPHDVDGRDTQSTPTSSPRRSQERVVKRVWGRLT